MAKGKPKHHRATVEDLLGKKTARRRIPRKWQEAYERLAKLREAYQRQQASLSRDTVPISQHTGMHMADAGTDESEQDMAFGLISFDRDTLYEIDQAIERIHDGTYGVCEVTGKPIRAARLKAVPWTRFSAQAERELESEGIARRAGAGRRELPESGEPAEPAEPEPE